MPHVGYADSIMNDGPRFHSNILVRAPGPIARAIEVTLPTPTLLF